MTLQKATHVADVFFKTVQLGKTTFGELAASIAQVAPIAAASNIELEQVFAAIASLTKQGTPTAEAITQIRQAILALNDNLGDGWAKTMTLQDGMIKLREASGGSDTKLKNMVGRVEGLNAILALTGKSTQMAASDLAAVGNAADAATKAYDEQNKAIQRNIDITKQWVNAKITGAMRDMWNGMYAKIGEWKSSWDTMDKFLKDTNASLERFLGLSDEVKAKKSSGNPGGFDIFTGNSLEQVTQQTKQTVEESAKMNEEWTVAGKTMNEIANHITYVQNELGDMIPGTEAWRAKVAEVNKLQDMISTNMDKQKRSLSEMMELAKNMGIKGRGAETIPGDIFGNKDMAGINGFTGVDPKEKLNQELEGEKKIAKQREDGLSAANNLVSTLTRRFDKAGDGFLSDLQEGISFISDMISMVSDVSTIISSLATLSTFALHSGGTVSMSSGVAKKVPAFKNGVQFTVPDGYENDSFLMRVSSKEKVSVYPSWAASQAGQDSNNTAILNHISKQLGALNMNLALKDWNVHVENNAPNVETVVKTQKQVERRLLNNGVDL